MSADCFWITNIFPSFSSYEQEPTSYICEGFLFWGFEETGSMTLGDDSQSPLQKKRGGTKTPTPET